MTRLAALALFMLAGCEQMDETASQAAWAEDQSAENFERIADLTARVEELETQLGDLESSDDLHGQNIDTLFANDNEIETFANETEDRVATVETRLGM